VVCAGLAFLKRRNASSISAGDHGFGLLDFRDFFLGIRVVLRAIVSI
jgi:hypothetical protein